MKNQLQPPPFTNQKFGASFISGKKFKKILIYQLGQYSMSEIMASIAKWFKDRTTSPLYGTFILSAILLNWKLFYILFWQNEEYLLLPRIEYVQQTILDQQSFWSHLARLTIFPVISTYLIIWWLPMLSNWAHKKHIEFYYERKLIFDKARLEYENKEKKTLISIATLKKEQVEVKKEIQKNTLPEDEWLVEFEDFKKNILFKKLKQLKDVLYEYGGKTVVGGERQVNSDILAMAHTKGLILIKESGYQEKIELTEKGKFFLKKYLENNL